MLFGAGRQAENCPDGRFESARYYSDPNLAIQTDYYHEREETMDFLPYFMKHANPNRDGNTSRCFPCTPQPQVSLTVNDTFMRLQKNEGRKYNLFPPAESADSKLFGISRKCNIGKELEDQADRRDFFDNALYDAEYRGVSMRPYLVGTVGDRPKKKMSVRPSYVTQPDLDSCNEESFKGVYPS